MADWLGRTGEAATQSKLARSAVIRLANGSVVAHPEEQLARQLDAVREVLRPRIIKHAFGSVDKQGVNTYQSVYSPQVSDAMRHERRRYGAVYGSFNGLASRIERGAVVAPLVVLEGQARVELAEAVPAARTQGRPAVPAQVPPAVPASALQGGRLRTSGVHVGQFGLLVGQRLNEGRNLASLALGSLRS